MAVTSGDFASAVQPVVAETLVITPDAGLLTRDVSVPTSDGSIPAYLAAPLDQSGLPVVLVIQEIFGVHEHIRDVARRLAKLGYLAIAPDLYHRQGDVSGLDRIERVREVVARVPDAQVLADLDAALAFATSHGGDASRVAVTGFCWGGRITWLYAAHQPKLKAAVAWYGRLIGEPTTLQPTFPFNVLASLKAPVLGLYGGQDQGIPLEHVRKAQAALERSHTESRIYVYPDAPHAFYADYRPSYRKSAADDGFERLQRWFKTHGV
jgi:carboxymethylenebutenolidase